jgi:hypothetical protein
VSYHGEAGGATKFDGYISRVRCGSWVADEPLFVLFSLPYGSSSLVELLLHLPVSPFLCRADASGGGAGCGGAVLDALCWDGGESPPTVHTV